MQMNGFFPVEWNTPGVQLDLEFRQSAEMPSVLTVAELTGRIRSLLETAVGEVWVEGEISNYRRQSSGHHYFTLKDGSAQLACVLFAGDARSVKVRLEDGLAVQAFGRVTVYEARGQYQLVVRQVQARGAGALQAKFEALKQKLAAEGLFDAARKRPLPPYPRRIGLITSPTGAAIRDFLNVLWRRQPGIEVVLFPVRVQGAGASREIAAALDAFANGEGIGVVDLLVLTRGGGSIEDLWEFNEEIVARAIARSPVPVVNAVGHEIDFTIADFVADLRAPTPSAAAELIAADGGLLAQHLRQTIRRMGAACRNAFDLLAARLQSARRSAGFGEPLRRIRERQQDLDRRMEDLRHFPAMRLQEYRQRLEQFRHLRRTVDVAFAQARERLAQKSALLEIMNPLATLQRGYTITTDAKGTILRSAQGVQGELVTRFADGEVKSRT